MPAELGVIAFSLVVALAVIRLWAGIQRSVTAPALRWPGGGHDTREGWGIDGPPGGARWPHDQ
jgi:hypothetical protein